MQFDPSDATGAGDRGGDPLELQLTDGTDVHASLSVKVRPTVSMAKMSVICAKFSGKEKPMPESARDEMLLALSWFRRGCVSVINLPHFERHVAFLIVWDLVMTALEVDHVGGVSVYLFHMSSVVISFCFGVELVVRIGAHLGNKCDMLLLFDAIIELVSITDAILRLRRMKTVETGIIGSELHVIGALRIFRLLRIIKDTRAVMTHAPAIFLLVQGGRKSIKQLCNVLLLAGLLTFAFSVMLTMLVPSATVAGDGARNSVAVVAFGTIGRSSYTVISAMAGGTEWGIHLVFPLLEEYVGVGSIFLLITLLVAALVLVVVLSGLVTGVFLERVLHVSAQCQAAEKQTQLAAIQTALRDLANAFAENGLSGQDMITWQDVARIMREYPEEWAAVKVAELDAKSMFNQLDELDHITNLDEFLVGLFTLRSVSRSIDMLSIDYEQERALQKMCEFRSNMRLSFATFQSRLHSVIALLQSLEKEVEIVRDGIAKLRELESQLLDLQAENTAALSGVPHVSRVVQRKRDPPQLSTAELMADEELNRRLCELEKEMSQLSSDSSGDGRSDLDGQAAAMSEVAVEVVHRFQHMLQEELEQAIDQAGHRPLSPSRPRHAAGDTLALPQRPPSKQGSVSYLWGALHNPATDP